MAYDDWVFSRNVIHNTISPDGLSIFRIPENRTLDVRDAAALWNTINRGFYPARAVKHTGDSDYGSDSFSGVVYPYIENTRENHASDEERVEFLINTFNRTGLVLFDAAKPEQLLKAGKNSIVYINVDNIHQSEALLDGRSASIRVDSPLLTQAERQKRPYKLEPDYFLTFPENPKTVATIKAILVIKNIAPEQCNASFLETNGELVSTLAKHYDEWLKKPDYTFDGAITALKQANVTSSTAPAGPRQEALTPLEAVKWECLHQLQSYVHSRGSLYNAGTAFNPSKITSLFRDEVLTQKKALEVQKLMKGIQMASSIEDIRNLIDAVKNKPQMTKSGFFTNSDLKKTLETCAEIANSQNDPSSLYAP